MPSFFKSNKSSVLYEVLSDSRFQRVSSVNYMERRISILRQWFDPVSRIAFCAFPHGSLRGCVSDSARIGPHRAWDSARPRMGFGGGPVPSASESGRFRDPGAYRTLRGRETSGSGRMRLCAPGGPEPTGDPPPVHRVDDGSSPDSSPACPPTIGPVRPGHRGIRKGAPIRGRGRGPAGIWGRLARILG